MSIVRVLLLLSHLCQTYTNTTSTDLLNQTDVLGEIYVPPTFKEHYNRTRVDESTNEDSDGDDDKISTTSELPPPTERPGNQSFLNTAEQWFNFHLGTLALPVPIDGHQELSFKWHVTVYITTKTPFMQICGGSLVTRSVAISAAHCFWDDTELLPASQFAVAAGKRYRRWLKLQVHASNVTEIIIPPRFLGEKTSFQDDIAIVKMATAVQENFYSAQPLCVDFDLALDRRHLTSGNMGTITGFGLTEEDGRPSKELNYQNLPYVDIRDCISASDPSFLKYLTGDKICAGDQHTGRALCRGDSGGGLVFFEGNSTVNVPYLRGIASAAPRNEHKCNAFAIGSFTHLRTHRTFLRDNIPGLEEECRTVYAKELAEIAKNRSIASQSFKEKENRTLTYRANNQSNASQTVTKDSEAKGDGNTDDTSVTIANDHKTGNDSNDENNTDPVEEDTTDENLLKTFPKQVEAIGESSAPEYQWHTTIYSTVKKPYLPRCGATLVKRDVIISAAHCFKEDTRLSSPKQFAAAAGKLHRPWGDPRDEYVQYSDVKQIVIHEEFRAIKTKTRSCYQHNLAVLTLVTPFSYNPGVKPACVDFGGELDREHLMSGSFGKFIGWGNIQRNCEPYNSLHYRELPYVDLGCIADFSLSNFDMVSDDDVCASLNVILGDELVPAYVRISPPCNIDSGGGLTYLDKKRSNIVPYLRGVATATIAGNPCNHFILDTFTHLRADKEFLKTVIPGLEEECDIAYPEEGTKDPSAYDMNIPVNEETRKGINRTINGDEKQLILDENNDRPSVNRESKPDAGTGKSLNTTNTPNQETKTDIPNNVQFETNPNLNLHIPYTQPIDLNIDTTIWKKKDETMIVNFTSGMSGDSSATIFPWHVGVYSKAWMPYMLICGGSIVKRDVVLSAAHCFWSEDFGPQSPALFAVAAGKSHPSWDDNSDDDAQYSHVREIIFPDRFLAVKTNFRADIAVVRLSTALEYGARVQPICMDFVLEAEKQQLRTVPVEIVRNFSVARRGALGVLCFVFLIFHTVINNHTK